MQHINSAKLVPAKNVSGLENIVSANISGFAVYSDIAVTTSCDKRSVVRMNQSSGAVLVYCGVWCVAEALPIRPDYIVYTLVVNCVLSN